MHTFLKHEREPMMLLSVPVKFGGRAETAKEKTTISKNKLKPGCKQG